MFWSEKALEVEKSGNTPPPRIPENENPPTGLFGKFEKFGCRCGSVFSSGIIIVRIKMMLP